MKKHYIIPIFVPHEGCPHGCVFCNQNDITGEYDRMDGERVEKTILAYLDTIPDREQKYVEVGYFGGSFTGIPLKKQQELLEPARKAKSEHRIAAIRLSTRPDYINERILDHLHQFCVDTIEIGVQSFSEEVLIAAERGHTAEQARQACGLIRESGFALGIQLMVGLPGDGYDGWIRSVKETVKIKPDAVRIYPTLVLADTHLAELMEQGLYHPLTLAKGVEWCRDGLVLFRLANIPVIRIGLQPTEEISPNAKVLAGPYHPAMRQLVESSMILALLCTAMGEVSGQVAQGDEIELFVPEGQESYFRGQKNSNLHSLSSMYPNWRFRIIQDVLTKDNEFIFQWSQGSRRFLLEELMTKWVVGR